MRPLLDALERSDDEARKTVVYLLSCLSDKKTTALPIARQLEQKSAAVRYEAIGAIDAFRPFFADVELKEVITNDFAMPYNINRVYVCRSPTMAPSAIWYYLKNY